MNKTIKRERGAGTNFYFDDFTERNNLDISDEGRRIIFKRILE
jgi:hypothetical protein